MPESRLQRTRETLPEGYQFGDASCAARFDVALAQTMAHHPFTPQGIADAVDEAAGIAVYGDNATTGATVSRAWNTIEADHAPTWEQRCDAAARQR